MSLALRQQLKLGQQLTMTPKMQQAIKILQLPRLELEQYIQNQIAENPVLEEKEYGPEEPLTHIENTTDKLLLQHLKEAGGSCDDKQDEIDWDFMARQKEAWQTHQNHHSHRHSSGKKDTLVFDHMISQEKTLSDHLHEQIILLELDEKQRMIAREIIGNINDKGYLDSSTKDIANTLKINQKEVEEVLGWVQKCEPTGIAARSLEECLTLQMNEWGREDHHLLQIVASQSKELERKNYEQIAKNLQISIAAVDQAVSLLAELEPIPARSYQTKPSPYISVDVTLAKISNKWAVLSHDDSLPNLQISQYYLNRISSLRHQGQKSTEKTYLQDKIRSGQWLMKSLWQRQATILKVAQVIVDKQTTFFDKGSMHLVPMTLKDVAKDVGVHESTISRVTSGKYMQTPRGVFELRYFFSSSIPSRVAPSTHLAGESVRKKIAKLISAEDPKSPLSDQQIVHILAIDGITLARRTVAKYRDHMAIPSSSRRKRFA
ncbi:MAG: RNA polymerase factor sigma-54 [Proteobacteria bacterium]|nr:RNA polymerase factor sigma-54 [Pseudomonadota bacterium]